ncbi:hypothetical protein GALL_350150 [mine drainage metagenome]|uniref:Uncharacterized protein n=1 Tax=mine drainage metagenome TaxID=410659 RepID=A0A1J5QI87_9ZZZZ
MATADSTTLSAEQLKIAMETIATLANAIDGVFSSAITDAALRDVVRPLISQIGLIADRCTDFDICGLDSWILPPVFEWAANKEAVKELSDATA